ncbi:MAG: beta-L-arabinofuranosidase domain-containing protein [Candidatus Latescibacterota bacterium]
MQVTTVPHPGTEASNAFYPANRAPLLPSPLSKLPLGSVRPKGWLKHELDLMINGMTGRLMEVSDFLKPENGWFGGDQEGWEEQGYWFRGFHDLAVLTGDERLLEEAHRWIEAVITSQDADGYFGASIHKCLVGENGQQVCDLWPHMVMLDAVISHHEHTEDPRVIPMMTRFFEFCRDLDEEQFIPIIVTAEFGSWKPCIQRSRAGDMLPHLYWLYNHTGQTWLLDLATRFHEHTAPPADEWLDHHIVNFTQRFRYPGNYYVQSKAARHLATTDYWYTQHLTTWGQQPRGIFAADELIRTGCTDPRQGFETCGMTEFAKSFYLLGRITGDPKYADRCEDVMLNHFPVSQTPDRKGLHYLTASNQPQLDASGEHEYQNKGRQISYSPHDYRCCQHNVAMGWPWYVQNLWQATSDNGLAAWLYGACDVTAQVGEGAVVTLHEETDYPFEGAAAMTIETSEPVAFPLYLRVPRWCRGFSVVLNGQPLDAAPDPGTYLRLERIWSDGDTITIAMPMTISLTEWPRNGSVTVDRGPLSYSVKIEEEWRRCGGTDEWPEWEVFPTTPWNWGLLLDREDPGASLAVKEKGKVSDQPWTVEAAPIEIRARGKRIPTWGLENETVEEVKNSPVASNCPEEEITLIPLGCARLRMSCFPTVNPS